MPQISQIGEIYASQLFWLLIFFGAVLAVVGYGMLPKIQSTVAQRDGQIAADLKVAEGARAEADRMEAEHRALMDKSRTEANARNAAAKAEAQRATEARLAKADAEAEEKTGAAMARIEAARTAAVAEIGAVAGDVAQAMVARVAGLSVDDATAAAAVARVMEKEPAHG